VASQTKDKSLHSLLVRAFTGSSLCLLILLVFQVENFFCSDRS